MRKHALHLVTTAKQELEQVATIVASFPSGIVDVLHIREKHRGAKEIAVWHRKLTKSNTLSQIYINDRLDSAIACDAPGLQLGYTSLDLVDARRIAGTMMKLGCSVHSIEEAKQCAVQGANYLVFGHIYPTDSKPGLDARGTKTLQQIVDAVEIPVIAIGGITPERTEEVLATGCAGIAILSSVFLHSDSAGQALRFREALDASESVPRRSWFTHV